MSIEAFSDVIKSEVYKNWFNSISKNVALHKLDDLRQGEQGASKTDFLLTTTALKKTYSTITGRELSNQRAQRLLTNIAAMAEKAGKQPQKMTRNGVDSILIESIAFSTIGTYMNNGFRQYKEILEIFDSPEVNTKSVGNYVHRGHVVGIATNLTKDLKDNLESFEGIPNKQKEVFLTILNSYIKALEKADIATSNMPSQIKEGGIYAKYTKSVSEGGTGKYLVEIQVGSENMSAGSMAGTLISQLSTLLSGDTEVLKKVIQSNITLPKTLFKTKGSPSLEDMIVLSMLNILKTGKPKKQEYVIPKTKVVDRPIKVVKKTANKEIVKLKKLKEETKTLIAKNKQFRDSQGKFQTLNLTNLQNLLNAKLHEQIRANMGTGSSKNILNYRTGRFSESAKVERLSESRQGMITAFYSYMKYPYATFSEGGQQQYPRSRDPKLLISKSIRELAGTQVANRMRAVNV